MGRWWHFETSEKLIFNVFWLYGEMNLWLPFLKERCLQQFPAIAEKLGQIRVSQALSLYFLFPLLIGLGQNTAAVTVSSGAGRYVICMCLCVHVGGWYGAQAGTGTARVHHPTWSAPAALSNSNGPFSHPWVFSCFFLVLVLLNDFWVYKGCSRHSQK